MQRPAAAGQPTPRRIRRSRASARATPPRAASVSKCGASSCAERSSPREEQYLFQYHVRISNVGTETAQLVSREWIITNADGEVERRQGPGRGRRKARAGARRGLRVHELLPAQDPGRLDAGQLSDGDARTARASTPPSAPLRWPCHDPCTEASAGREAEKAERADEGGEGGERGRELSHLCHLCPLRLRAHAQSRCAFSESPISTAPTESTPSIAASPARRCPRRRTAPSADRASAARRSRSGTR